MKALQITSAIFLIIGLGILMLYIFSNTFNMTYKVLDCESGYSSKLFERDKGLTYNNAKADVGICLCEKYIKNNNSLYKEEILKLYDQHTYKIIFDYIKINKEDKVDTICKHRTDAFMKMYNY